MLFEILYIVHKRACLRREARGSQSRSFITEVRLRNIYNPLYKNEQLSFEYFPDYLHHINSADPRLATDAYSNLGRTRVLYRRHVVSSSQNQKFLLVRFKVSVALEDNS